MGRWKLYVLGVERMVAADGQPAAVPDICWPLVGCLLAMPGRSASRATIADELWRDDVDDSTARHRLGTALWRIRTRLPPLETALASTGDRLALRLEAGIWIDAIAFEARAEAALGNRTRLAAPAERHKLRRALAHYQGDFLARRDHDAIAIERERLRLLFIDASYELALAEAGAGDWAAARDSARRLCAVEPLREDGQRLLIEAYAASGSRALAIQQYRLLERVLADELGVAPMEETRQLAERVSGTSLRSEPPATEIRSPGPMSWRARFRETLISTRDQISRAIELLDDPPIA